MIKFLIDLFTNKKVKFKITTDHIKNGIPYKTEVCPTALCIKEKVREDLRIMVTEQEVYIMDAPLFYMVDGIILPPNVKEFIHNLDQGKSVKPITFKLNIKRDFLK